EARGRIAFRQPAQRLGFGRAAADDPVPPEFKYIANAGDGDRAILRRERPLFDRAVNLAEDNVVDLVECEAGGLDGRVGQGQPRIKQLIKLRFLSSGQPSFMRHFRDLLRGCEKSVRKRHQGVFFSESQGVSLEVDFRWYGSLSDCVLGSTENRISGSNPSLSATN